MNLLAWPAVAHEHGHDELVEGVELGDDLGRAGVLGEGRELADVDEEDGHLDLLALDHRALLEHALGELRVDEGAERLAQALALLEAGDHLVEGLRQAAGLVGAEHGHADAEVARGHALGALAQVLDRLDHRAREQGRELEGEREGDDERDQHADAQRAQARVLGGQAGDDDAGDDVDDRQRDEQLAAQRHRALAEVGAVGQGAGDVGQHRAHGQLGDEEAQEDAVGEHDQRAGGDGQEAQEGAVELERDEDRDRDRVERDRECRARSAGGRRAARRAPTTRPAPCPACARRAASDRPGARAGRPATGRRRPRARRGPPTRRGCARTCPARCRRRG